MGELIMLVGIVGFATVITATVGVTLGLLVRLGEYALRRGRN